MPRKTLEWNTIKYGMGTIKKLTMMVFDVSEFYNFPRCLCISPVTKKILIENKIKWAHIPMNCTQAEMN